MAVANTILRIANRLTARTIMYHERGAD